MISSVKPIGKTAALALALSLASVSVHGQNAPEPSFPAGIRLPENSRGEAAIAALGKRLPDVAAYYGKSPRQLREVFRKDRSLHVDMTGQLFFACELECEDCGHAETAEQNITPENIEPTGPAPFDTSEAFLLHSLPGASRVIYLDFDGHVDNTRGNWKDGAYAKPFDMDGDPTTFNTTERNRIIGVWQRVAEDFAMYRIDVTTEEPNVEALRKTSSGDSAYGMRVCIGGSGNDWYGNNVGGVALVGTFDSNQDVPCWVFPAGTGTSDKNMAEATSHEIGHTLGLLHDNVDGGGTYRGHGNWGPIMGVSYSKAISQWSKGEYANASNTQDDLAVMLTQGAVYRPDDHGGSIASATEISADADFVEADGVIERGTDLDFFQIDAAGGSLAINVTPAPRGPNLRLEVKLYDSGGVLLQTATAADTSGGTQPVTLSFSVAAGVHYFSVDGIGSGDPLTNGYSDYASLGQYTATVTGVVPGGFTWLPVAAGTRQWNTAADWATAIVPNAADTTVRINNDITGNQTIQLADVTTIGSLFLGDANSTHGFTLASDGGSLVFNNSGNPAELSKTIGATDLISVPVVLADALFVSQSASGTLEFSGEISGSGSLTKSGAGTVAFNAPNTYSGITSLADGLLLLNDSEGLPGGIDQAVGAEESGMVFNGGVLGITADFTRDLGTGDGQLNWSAGSGGFAAFGADREVRLNNGTGALSWNSAIVGSNNILILSHPSATHTINFRNGISFAGSQRTVLVEDGEAAVDAVLGGVLSAGNSSGLRKIGPGVLSLANANTYSGATTLDGGVLRLQHPGALPSGNLELTGRGILGLGAGDLTARTLGTGVDQLRWTGEGGFAAFGADRAVKFSDSTLNWSVANFIGGSRALILGHDSADATLDWQQGISLAGSTRIIQVDDGSADIDVKMSGIVTGGLSGTYSSSFDKAGAGTLAFTIQNNYRGDTIVSLGTLMIGDGGTTGGVSQNTQSIFVDSGATLAVNRNNTVTQGTDPFMVPVSGDGGFAQVGTGATELTLANTYGGPTSITAGTLVLGASDVLPDLTDVSIGSAILGVGAGLTDATGTLDVTGAATLHLDDASSALSFANSSSIGWTGTLDLTGAFVSGASIRFGTDGTGLDASQLSRISATGFGSFALDSNGYLTAVSTAGYTAWKTTNAPDTGTDPAADEDGDGVANGVEYLLGGSILTNDSAKLPQISTSEGNMLFSFKRDQASIDGSTTVEIETSPDLADWPTAYPVPDGAASSVPGVSVIKNDPPGYDTVTLALPVSADLWKFVRLKVTP